LPAVRQKLHLSPCRDFRSRLSGKVDHGSDKASAADLQKRLKPLIQRTQPYAKRTAHKGNWIEPKLLAEVEYRAKSAAPPVLQGVREHR
jgi:bifunctional non-homologous end joining protein LigD